MEAIHKEEYRGHTICIYVDESPANPRVDWDNLGHIVALHRNYDLADKGAPGIAGHSSWDEVRKALEDAWDAKVILPIYMYDHSGISIRTRPFNDRWDSGQVGFIYVTEKDIEKEYGSVTKEHIATATRVLEGEVENYDQYLRGDVYGYRVFKGTGVDEDELDAEETDSCWGFFGDYDDKEYGALEEAKSALDRHIAYDLKQAKEKAELDINAVLTVERPHLLKED